MCRIAAIISGNHIHLHEKIKRMTDSMAHGGPDDAGLWMDDELGIALGHRRLSIIDLSAAGHQPMIDNEHGLIISFNGEIYNFIELRNELIKLGYVFNSHSDTEVLLKGYHAWGKEMLPRLKGMFAFLLLDRNKQQLIAARDHAGIKPLYYGKYHGNFYCSSEVRGLLAAQTEWPQDENWQIRFLSYGFIPEPFSTLEGVFHLPKGSCMVYDLQKDTYTIDTYIQFPFTSQITDPAEAVAKTRETLLQAVQRHLVADVPVGIFLSGGIDSSLLTIACRMFNKEQIKTLSIYFDDEKYSEKYYQDIVVKKTGVSHKAFKVSQADFEESLPEVFRAMDQPSIDGINSFFITRYAKQYGLKVVLSGLGADELFGGYSSFYDTRYARVKKMRMVAKVARLFFHKYPVKKLDFLRNGDSLEEYLFNRGLFVPVDVASILKVAEEKVWEVLEQNNGMNGKHLAPGNRTSILEQDMYMQSQLLRDSDIYSMWHSIELRVPFLDVDVIKLAHSIAPEIKFNAAKKKHLLIEAFAEELPEEIWNRQKMGFTFPFQNWFTNSAYLKNSENEMPQLQKVRGQFDKGTLNWSRYWSQVVEAEFGRKVFEPQRHSGTKLHEGINE